MSKFKKLIKHRVNRFGLVGIANAVISFALLNFIFYSLGQSKIVSSIISTGMALVFSFVLNRNFVFVDKSERAHKQFVAFAIVTVIGSFIILNLVYIFTLKVLLTGHESLIITPIKTLSGIKLSANFVDINVSTVVGAVVAMIWNYNGYRLFVFRGSAPTEEANTDGE